MSEPAWVPISGAAFAPAPQSMELIDKVDLSLVGGFSTIPQDYDTLRLVYKSRLVTAVVGDPLYLRANDVATAAYDTSRIYIDNNVLSKDVLVSQTEARIATAPGASAAAGEFVHGEVVIPGYALVGDVKTWFGSYMGLHTRSVTGVFQGTIGGSWYSSAAITKLSLIGQGGGLQAVGSAAWLYGMRGAKGAPYAPLSGALMGTTLPASPVDGQEFILTDSLTAGTYAWHLRYVAGRASNKWVFVGGAPLAGDNAAGVGANATTYATPAGAITLAVPVAGQYLVQLGFRNTAWTSAVVYMSYAIGGTGAVDADACMGGPQITPGGESQNFRSYRKTFAAAATLTEQLKVTGGNNSPYHRFLSVTPIAVGG